MKLSGTALGRSLEPPTSRKLTWCVMERVKSSLFSSHCPHWLVSLVSLLSFSLHFVFPLPASTYLLCSLIPFIHFLPSFLTSRIHFFSIPLISFLSLQAPLCLSLSSSRSSLSVSLSVCQQPSGLFVFILCLENKV